MRRFLNWSLLSPLLVAACGQAPEEPTGSDARWIEGYEHRLVLKFKDEQQARATGTKFDLSTDDEEALLADLVARHDLRFAPVFGLSDVKLDALAQSLAGGTDLRGFYSGQPTKDRDGALAALADFASIEAIEKAYLEPLNVPPPGDIEPATERYVDGQTYRDAIEAVAAHSAGIVGKDIRLGDVEYGWNAKHEDLVDRTITFEPGMATASWVFSNNWDDHGTAVLGQTSGVDNGYGVTGLAHGADVYVFPENTDATGARRAAAIASAAQTFRPGDVLMLEMQTPGANGAYGPAEYDLAVWQAVKAATDAGIIVIAAAGNGSEDLDSPGYAEYRDRGDSGAIIVGAGSLEHRRLGFSTYGARVDVRGIGENIITLGYGDHAMPGNDPNQEYTARFGGTSSSTPIVASAVVLIQNRAMQLRGRPLSPREMRDLLIQSGTPQIEAEGNHIGPLPNVRAALALLEAAPPPPPPPPTTKLVINEVLADPAAGFDASGDGAASTTGDEFIEFVNAGTTAIDLSGATVSDAIGVRVTLPVGTILAPGKALVLFGGGAIGASSDDVQRLSLGSLALNNNGDIITVRLGETVLATMTYGSEGGRDQSLVRATEADSNAAFVLHKTLGAASASPGKRSDGSNF